MIFAVIDTETNWQNQLMSIGLVLIEDNTYKIINKRYYIITPNYQVGGMYESSLLLPNIKVDQYCSKNKAISFINSLFKEYDVNTILAYNAKFDYSLLYELNNYIWKDILSLAAYKQYNNKIPVDAPCCSTGRLKTHYGVEPIYRLLKNDFKYFELHNALTDAIDEAEIVKMLNQPLELYKIINAKF